LIAATNVRWTEYLLRCHAKIIYSDFWFVDGVEAILDFSECQFPFWSLQLDERTLQIREEAVAEDGRGRFGAKKAPRLRAGPV
jgi:hypothetical protein